MPDLVLLTSLFVKAHAVLNLAHAVLLQAHAVSLQAHAEQRRSIADVATIGCRFINDSQ